MLFEPGTIDVKYFLGWVHAVSAVPTRAFVAVLTEKSQRKTSEQFTTGFAANKEELVMREIGTEQVWQVLHLSHPVFTHSKGDPRILNPSFCLAETGIPPLDF